MSRASPLLLAALIAALAAPTAWADRYRARRSYEHAQELLQTGEFARALSEASDAIRAQSDLAAAYALRARIWQTLGDAPAARRDADQAVDRLRRSLSTLGVDDLVAYGNALLVRGQVEHALPNFETALQLDAGAEEALLGRSRVWRLRGQPAKALPDLDEIVKRKPRAALYWYHRAYAYYELGRYDDCIADLTQALRINRNFYPAYGLVGAALAQKGDTRRALAAYDKAAAVNPQYSFAHLGRAALRLAAGDEQKAFADLDEAVRVDGDNFAPYFNRAEAWWAKGNRDKAIEDYRRALGALSLDAEFALRIGDRLAAMTLWREAVQAYTRAYALAGGEEDRRTPLARERGSQSALRLERAEKPLPPKPRRGQAAAVSLSKPGVAALMRRARAWEALKEPKAALADLSEAVDRDPSAAHAWAARGTLRLKLGLAEEALADLNQAIKLEPKNPEVRALRGSYHARTGRPKLALDDFNAAIESDPGSAEAYNNRGALQANSFADLDKARRDVEKAVELSPRNPDYAYNLAMVKLKQREFRSAIDSFDQALRLQGPPARILASRADAYSQLGDHANALQDIQTALERDPKQSSLYATLGAIRMRKHDYEQAIRDLNQALRLEADNPAALILRGQAHGALGNLRAARKDFQRAAELDRNSKEAYVNLCHVKRLMRSAGDAVSDCSRAIELDPYYAQAYLHRGLAYLRLRNSAKTIEDIDAARQLGLLRAEGLLAQAVAHAGARQYREAHRFFAMAIKLDAGARSPEIRFAPSRASDAEDYFNAIADLEPLMRSDVNNPYMFLVRGDSFYSAEHFDKAVVEYTKAMELDGTVVEAHLARGNALTAQESYDAAFQDYRRAIELAPRSAEPYVRMGTLLTLRRDYKGAVAQLGAALKLEPQNAEAYLRAGNAYYFLKDFKRALANYELAVKHGALDPNAHNGLGLGHFASGRYPEALESFSRAIALNPFSDRFFRNRASTYTNMRRFSNAAAEFRQASLLNTDPTLVEEYKKLIDESESRSASGKS